MIKVVLDTSPLGNANSIRGVGMYTRLLLEYLQKTPGIEVVQHFDQPQGFVPDVIHYPYFDLFFATLPWRKKTPTVVTVHDVIPLKFPAFYPTGKKGWVRFQRQKLALKWTNAVITDSLASKADIHQHLGIKDANIFPIYLAAHPELKKPSDDELKAVRKRFVLPSQYILYVGDINYNKNLPQLIKSLKFLPEKIHLVCVGKNFQAQDIPEWQWIETQIAMSNVGQRIHFISDIPAQGLAELSALYSGALVYVQPSLYEGFGLPVLEAMRCQTPVVATDTSSLIEVGGEVVKFAEPTAESLAAKVEEVISVSEDERKKITRKAYRWSQEFTWEKTALETKKVYQQVIKPT